jgi:hypothetical protein
LKPANGKPAEYLMAGQLSELDRLQIQSRVWEPAGVALLEELGDGMGQRAVDVRWGTTFSLIQAFVRVG